MMDHIVAHSMQVCQVATYLTDHLIGHHPHLNADLIRSAALLHDITKTRSRCGKQAKVHCIRNTQASSGKVWSRPETDHFTR